MSDRNQDERRWDLTRIYASDQAWEEDIGRLKEGLATISAFEGRLAGDLGILADLLDLRFEIYRRESRLHAYASMRADEDTRQAGPRGRKQQISAFSAEVAAALSFIDPEILQVPREALQNQIDSEPRLAPYRRTLDKLERRRAHTLESAMEDLLGRTQLIRGDGETISGILLDAEIPWPELEFEGREKIRLDPSGYTRARTRSSRPERKEVFQSFHSNLQEFNGALGASLYSTVKEHHFEAQARKHETCLTAALHTNEVDPAVYHTLIREVGGALGSLHRYLELRARILGIKDLAYHDLYPPLVSDLQRDYSWPVCRELVLDSLAPLGEQYFHQLKQALNQRWVDVDHRTGKRSGAYVNDGAFGVHPYMLLNHHDDFNSASTVAHEAGHLMHSWYSQNTQPYPTANYVIFVAEVASTFNEALLSAHMLAQETDPQGRLSLLGHYLESLRGTVFRQTMFAEFELAIHHAVEQGQSLTGESLNSLYLELLRRYHGHDQGVMAISPLVSAEWSFVPHFHYNFYVYQYATSFVAATALSRRVLDGTAGAVESYLEFLGSGSSRPPVELLKRAGVDMSSKEPIRATIAVMNDVMDEIETLL